MPELPGDPSKLIALRDEYPHQEWVEASIHFDRLRFLRWQVRRGDLGGPADGGSRPFPVAAFDSWVEEVYGQ
jgi:hypothetical protein